LVPSNLPRRTHRAGPHPIRFGIADKLSLEQIELKVSPQLLADVGSEANAHGPKHDFGVRHRELARPDAIKEISHVVHWPLRSGRVIGQHPVVFD
jgi:hypothetical protein